MRDLSMTYLGDLHVTELDNAALLATDGGLGWPELTWTVVTEFVVCVIKNADSIVDGFSEGAAGHY